MSTFRIAGRCIADPPPVDWREQLAARLGVKPRRMGTWAELGLYGALECLTDAEETQLSARASLIVSSQHGPATASLDAIRQAREDLPMPLIFLQTLPSLLLATLSVHLNWCGDARFIAHADPRALLRLAAVKNDLDGVLLGWVEESGEGSSIWLRLKPSAEPTGVFREIAALDEHLAQADFLRITHTELAVLVDSR